MKCYAGDIEAGDRLVRGQVLQVATGFGGFASREVSTDTTVVDVLDEHPYDATRVMLKAGAETFDLHRSRLVNVIGGTA